MEHYPLLEKYVSTLTSLYCTFCKSVGHDENNFRAYDMMNERRAYIMQGEKQEVQVATHYNAPQSGRGGYGGRGGYKGRGGYGGRGRG